jgi:hypothetical protein
MLVVMLARGYRPDAPNFVLDELRRGLAAAGARLIVDGAWSDSYARAGLIIGFEPFEDRKQLLGARVLGQRTLNRFQRMEIAATTEALVAEFGSPRNDDELSALTRDWGPFCVLKYDWSLRRNGVFAWPLGDTRPAFPSDFTPGCDLFMKFVDGDPKTYKVDAFCGTVLAGWILPTRSMREPDWQVIDVPEMLEFDVPPDARACVEAVSEALIAQGVGYASYDLMRGPRGFHLIEANTCAVSTAMWDVSPERYAANYLRAMLRALERIDRVPVWGSLRGTAYRAGHVQAAVPLPEKAAGAADAVTRAPPVGKPPAPASIEQRFFASLTKTERAPPDSLTRHVQTSLQALLHHAHRHSPFQRERLGFLFQWDGSVLWERWQDVPLLRFEDIVSRRHIMQCRVVPLGHGSSMQVRIDGADGAHATLSKSKLQAAAEFCIEARLYQWHGVDFSEDMATLWPAWLSTPAIGSRSSRRHFGVPRLDVALAEGVGADPFAHRNLGGAGTRNNGRRGADVATESQKPVHAGRADGQRNTPPLPRASRTRTDRGVSSRRSRSNRTAMSCVVRPSYPKRSLPCRGRRPKR